MNLATETITVFNRAHDPETDSDVWAGTVIHNVSWYCHVRDTVTDRGLKAANEYTIRIPLEAVAENNRTYVFPNEYNTANDASHFWTVAPGDVIVKGKAETVGQTPVTLKHAYKMCTVLGVTDNRRAPNAPHLRIVGG